MQLHRGELFCYINWKDPDNIPLPYNMLLPLLVWNLTNIFLTFASKFPLLPSDDNFPLVFLPGKSKKLKGNFVLFQTVRPLEVKKDLPGVIEMLRDRSEISQTPPLFYIMVIMPALCIHSILTGLGWASPVQTDSFSEPKTPIFPPSFFLRSLPLFLPSFHLSCYFNFHLIKFSWYVWSIILLDSVFLLCQK